VRGLGLLAAGEGLTPEEARIAAAVALLHDVGRFPQYRRWQTFRDSDSDNHARLGIEVIREQGTLNGLPEAERLLIEEAVRFPQPAGAAAPFHIAYCAVHPPDPRCRQAGYLACVPGLLPPAGGAAPLGGDPRFSRPVRVTPACVRELAAGRVIRLEDVRVLNDFKLLQISWVYDLNFRSSYRLLQQRGHIAALAATIPLDEPAAQAVAQAVATIDMHADYMNQTGEIRLRKSGTVR